MRLRTVSAATAAARKQGRTTETATGLSVIAWTLGLVALGTIIYRPWEQGPFEITDFSEFLPLLKDADGRWGRFEVLFGYYVDHGRANFLTPILTWVQWEMFGLSATGWRYARVLMWGLLIWTYLSAALRFGLQLFPAVAGAALFVLGWPATDGWLRYTAEPVSAICFLAALMNAARFRAAGSLVRSTLLLTLLSGAMVLTKEPLLVAVPVVLVVSIAWKKGEGFVRPILDRHTIVVSVALIGTMLLLGVGILLSVVASPPEAYARVYSNQPITISRVLYNILASSWPYGSPEELFSVFGFYSSVLVVSGCVIALRRETSRLLIGQLGLFLLVGFLGALVYSPWGRFEPFYAIPFLFGPAGCFALGLQGYRRPSKRGLLTSSGLALTVLTPLAVSAARETSFRIAMRELNWDLARALSEAPPIDSLFFAVESLPPQRWQGRGPTLARYASVMFDSPGEAPARDETCVSIKDRLSKTPTQAEGVVSYRHWCGPLESAEPTFLQEFGVPFLLPPRIERGQVAADLLFRGPPAEGDAAPPGAAGG